MFFTQKNLLTFYRDIRSVSAIERYSRLFFIFGCQFFYLFDLKTAYYGFFYTNRHFGIILNYILIIPLTIFN